MKNFSDYNIKPSNILKVIALVFVGVIVLTFAVRMFGTSLKSLNSGSALSAKVSGDAYSVRDSAYGIGGNVSGLSQRNVMPEAGEETMTSGNDAEAFEVTQYNAFIETRKLKDTCTKISDLKAQNEIIFENANEYEHGCAYTFKVEKEKTNGILELVQGLHPRDLSENTYTIKQVVEDYTGQLEILQKKQETIEKTLSEAITAYDEITQVARRSQNADALASIVDSKVRTLERLTQERINISAQIDRLSRAKAEQLDRLKYTYFYVNVSEIQYVDGNQVKDSWRIAVQNFVRDINEVAQDITVGLIALIFVILQYVLYLFLLLFVAKYFWKVAKALWKR